MNSCISFYDFYFIQKFYCCCYSHCCEEKSFALHLIAFTNCAFHLKYLITPVHLHKKNAAWQWNAHFPLCIVLHTLIQKSVSWFFMMFFLVFVTDATLSNEVLILLTKFNELSSFIPIKNGFHLHDVYSLSFPYLFLLLIHSLS